MRIISFLILLITFGLTKSYSQCDVFIDGDVSVTDNGSGVQFEFNVTNNSPDLWYGDVVKLYWSLNSSAPIWEIDYTNNTNTLPLVPGETRTIKTPWFDFPNLPSWFPDDPTPANPWVESNEWAYYDINVTGGPFTGAWAPMNLRLGGCSIDMDGDGVLDQNVKDENGDPYYGPFNSSCPDQDHDAFCDCDLDFIGFDPATLDVSVEVISHWNCGTTLNNGPSGNVDAINHIHFGLHVPGWDYQWGCTTGINHPGWTFTGWSALGVSNNLLYSGDVFNVNLLDLGPDAPCFEEILTNDTLTACSEIVLWQINYSQTLHVWEGGWAVNSSGNDTQIYPDHFFNLNSLNVCESPPPLYPGCIDEEATNYNPNAGYDDGTCLYGPVLGCTDPTACNYDSSATSNDGSCDYSCIGCTDENASNYNPDAIYDNNSCEYFFPDADPSVSFFGNDCVGEEYDPTYGVFVYNYGEDTLYQYCVEIPELGVDTCLDGNILGAAWIEPNAAQFIGLYTIPDSITQITVNVYNVSGEGIGDELNNTQIANVNQPPDNPCITIDPINLEIGNEAIWVPQGSCTNPYYNQSFIINNIDLGIVNNFSLEILVETWQGDLVYNGIQDYEITINPGESYTIIDFPDIFTGDLNYVTATLSWVNENGELQTDIQTFDILLWCWGCTDPAATNYINSPYIFDAIPDHWLNDFPNTTPPTPDQIECEYDIYGCTDEAANNYNPDANVDDGSCTYDIPGCTDPEANNYDPTATIDDGSCTYDILGCTDPIAINYNPFANVDDGSCEYDVPGCTDPLATNYNPLATMDDGSCEYVIYLGGCTDPEAINYNAQAIYDDGSCVYDPCSGTLGAVYYAPNTFTPNNDGINDGWTVVTNPECWLKWQVLIYNRWGQLIWESTIPGEVWPGSVFDGSYYVADGVYFYKVIGVGYNPANTFQTTGNINIFR